MAEQVTRDIIFHFLEINDYNVVIDGRIFFDQPVKNNLITYGNIWNTTTGQGDDYTTSCLLDHNGLNNYYKMIAIYLSKQQALDADPEAIQRVNFTANLDRRGNKPIFFIIEEAKETTLDFPQGTVKLLWMSSYDLAAGCSTILFYFNIILI